MTKKKRQSRLRKVGRKPVPMSKRHQWTLEELRARCGAEDDEECWDRYTGMHGQIPMSEHLRRYPAVVHGGAIKVLVRRLAWLLAHGEDPPEGTSLVMTKCSNQRCQNPYHAKPMWEADKCRRAAASGAYSSVARRMKIAAAKQAAGKLDWEKVEQIRASTARHKERPWKEWQISETMWKRIRAYKSWVPQDSAMARMAA